jgi:MFS family permease
VTRSRRQTILFAALYFSEGAPIGFLWWALPTRLRAAGVEVEAITGLLSLLVLPWALKFLAAPFVDILRTPRWPLRAWIAGSQLVMGLLILATIPVDWRVNFPLVGTLLFLHAAAAALQDVAIDAYAVQIVPAERLGSVNAWMQVGMLTGRSLFGGGALLIGAWAGPTATLYLLVAGIWLPMAVLLLAGEKEVHPATHTVPARSREFTSALGDVLRHPGTWFVLVFAAVGGAGFEAVGILVGPFLIDQGFSSTQVGAFLFLPTVAAMMAGAMAAGRLSDRWGRKQAARATLVGLAITIIGVGWTDVSWLNGAATLGLLMVFYGLIGAFTTTSYALFMEATDRRLGATQLSASMSATNLCESWSALAVGRLTSLWGYGVAFSVMAVLSLAALPALSRMGRRRQMSSEAAQQ